MSLEFIRKNFSEYYASAKIEIPDLRHREFGFGVEDKIDFRHKAFLSDEDLKNYLKNEAPLYASYSAAHYELPDARPMPRKNLLGADLVFDIDAPSRKIEHAHNDLLCRICLNSVKNDALRLQEEFLLGDFGFSKKDVEVNFSGQKGFHFHVRGESVQHLSANARKQLVAYLQGPADEKLLFESKKLLRGPTADAKGWGGKFHSQAKTFLAGATLEDLKSKGLRGKTALSAFENRLLVLSKMREGNWDAVKGLHVLWETILEETRLQHAVVVDSAVSFDLSRLIRLPDSLHGSSGFIAKRISALQDFTVDDAIAFSKEKTINVAADKNIEFELGGQLFELAEGKTVELPLFAGLFLLCKKAAKLVLG
ncbi:MAG: DNA primase catalytic subunit PriS [Candidatus Micrarchaeota archaeon]